MSPLSRKSRYGLRAVYRLARHHAKGPLTAGQIAEAEQIPRKFLEAILLQLQRNGIVKSWRGKNGGYQLAAAPGHLTIGSIVRAMDGPLVPLPCAGERDAERCPECPSLAECETRAVMVEVRQAVADILDRTNVEDICSRRNAYAAFTYEI
jgi:Rrf2 family protein